MISLCFWVMTHVVVGWLLPFKANEGLGFDDRSNCFPRHQHTCLSQDGVIIQE
jgi:hypothetical protein